MLQKWFTPTSSILHHPIHCIGFMKQPYMFLKEKKWQLDSLLYKNIGSFPDYNSIFQRVNIFYFFLIYHQI